MEKHSLNHDRAYEIEQCHSEQLKTHIFIKTVIEWNHLEQEVVHAETVEDTETRFSISQCVYAEKPCTVLIHFSLSVKAAPHECVIRTGQP